MTVLAFFRDLFKVETLDTRFCATRKATTTKPLWGSLESYFYALNFIIFVPLMITTAASAGSPSNPNYHKFSDKLSDGWMGRPVDNSDVQYSGFRSQFPVLALLATCHVVLRAALNAKAGRRRDIFDFLFALGLITALHGTGALKIVTILALNFYVGRQYRSRIVCWVFALAVLFANELLSGYPLFPSIEIGGILPQWQVYFKCTMMRMLSFNIDYLESLDPTSRGASLKDDEKLERQESHASTELYRICTPRPQKEYQFVNYIGYCLYAPLYLAGPILTFNDFRVQVQQPLPSISFRRTFAYAVRFVLCLLCMELVLHFIPVVAISSTRAWEGLTPAQVSMVGFFNLVVIWLKLLLPWRFFRLWALTDSIDPPENMVRCVSNNYSALSFWRSWHRSFHKWVVRYLYIPLGGSKHQLRNSLLVFAFVAAWHDIQLRLFVWGFLIVLFVMPEIIARALVPAKQYGSQKWYRMVAGVGAVANIWMMLIANLVGFAVGVDGIKNLLHEMMATTAGLRFAIICSLLLFVGAQAMFEYRETELRRGVDMKC